MTRPVYETGADQEREQVVADAVSKAWDIKLVKIKPLYHFDRAFVHNGEITGLLEIKCRTNSSSLYPDYMLSLDKYMKAIQFSEAMGITVYLAVQWTDVIGVVKLVYNENWKINIGGRQDRDDIQDMEPCVFIPIKEFKAIKS